MRLDSRSWSGERVHIEFRRESLVRIRVGELPGVYVGQGRSTLSRRQV